MDSFLCTTVNSVREKVIRPAPFRNGNKVFCLLLGRVAPQAVLLSLTPESEPTAGDKP